jgi:hypothetical protein
MKIKYNSMNRCILGRAAWFMTSSMPVLAKNREQYKIEQDAAVSVTKLK